MTPEWQGDWSFHQHGPQLYSGWGYGAMLTSNVLALEAYATAANVSNLQLSAGQWATLSSLVLDGQQLSVRGPNFDPEACGRLLTYYVNTSYAFGPLSHYHNYAAFTPFALAFQTFEAPFTTPLGVVFAPLLDSFSSRPRGDEMAAFAARLRGDAGAPSLGSLNRHFGDSDYMVHHRDAMFASRRMFSNRTLNSCVDLVVAPHSDAGFVSYLARVARQVSV